MLVTEFVNEYGKNCFLILVFKDKKYKLAEGVSLIFKISFISPSERLERLINSFPLPPQEAERAGCYATQVFGSFLSLKVHFTYLLLSNSGYVLKFLLPNTSVKASGSPKVTALDKTTHHNFCKFSRLCKAISQIMTEREIDYRGSKSRVLVSLSTNVKEQRVDGS